MAIKTIYSEYISDVIWNLGLRRGRRVRCTTWNIHEDPGEWTKLLSSDQVPCYSQMF